MGTYLIVFGAFITFVCLMALGVIFAKKPISGSCGGLNVAMRDEDGKCLSCGTKVDVKLQQTFDKKLGHK